MPLVTDESLPPDYRKFPDGSILRMVFHNFLTYEHTCFVPSQNLNMILGHNGSGKSSIICGICLACGGSPKSLGRSEKISEYIRHGCQEGYVEIAIADEHKGPQTVRLTLRTNKAPEYRLNNAIATQSIITDLRKHYNIQVDNPCAFLAQDKVKSFSEQSAIELLRNTEKAASDDLDQKHKYLIEQRQDSTTIEDKCESSEKAVKHLKNEIEKVQPLVDNYQKKLAMQSRLKLLDKKKKILEYEEADKELEAEKMKADDAMQEFHIAQNALKQCENKKEGINAKMIEDRKIINIKMRSANGILSRIQENTEKKLIEYEMKKAKDSLEMAKQEASNHAKNVEGARAKVKHAVAKLKELNEDLAGYDEAMAECQSIETALNERAAEVRREEDILNDKGYKLSTIRTKYNNEQQSQSNHTERLSLLTGDTREAYKWYEANRDKFKGPVYSPMMDIVIKSPEAPLMLQNSVSFRDSIILVCTNQDDERLLNNDTKPWRINTTVVFPERVRSNDINAALPSELQRLGFKCFISESFDAPGPLKQYLCNVSGIHKIPFGPISYDKLEEITKTLASFSMDIFMSPQKRFQVQRSMYSRNSIQTSNPLRSANVYVNKSLTKPPVRNTVNPMREKIEALRKEIEESRPILRRKRDDIERERSINKVKKEDWKIRKAGLTKWEYAIRAEKEKLQRLEASSSRTDLQDAEKVYEKAVKDTAEKAKKRLQEMVDGQKEYLEKYRDAARLVLIETIRRAQGAKLIVEIETHQAKLNDLKGMKDVAENQLRSAVEKKKIANDRLMSECELKNLDESQMSTTEKQLWKKLNEMFKEADVPTDLDTLIQAITNEQTRLKLAEDSGEDGSERHEQKLNKLKVDLATESAKRAKLFENRVLLHNKLGNEIDNWKEGIQTMIEQINNNYIKFFEFLGCRGEVSLDVPENPLDIERYGIMIMVCFRKGESMKRLDNKVQSGGERSVATMLYLLALQQLCPVPFRCIDEINQGMDPTNERKVFEIMVGLWNGTAGTLSKTQYFLLSPKLLHGLDLRDNVNIILANSTLNVDHRNFYKTEDKLNALFADLGIQA